MIPVKRIYSSLSFRVTVPGVLFMLVSGTILFVLLISLLSDFVQTSIKNDMRGLARVVYGIGDNLHRVFALERCPVGEQIEQCRPDGVDRTVLEVFQGILKLGECAFDRTVGTDLGLIPGAFLL